LRREREVGFKSGNLFVVFCDISEKDISSPIQVCMGEIILFLSMIDYIDKDRLCNIDQTNHHLFHSFQN
jgi:hypothetical protein